MSSIKSYLRSLYKKPPLKCLILGLDASGKTTLLYSWFLGEQVTTIPTIGFNVEDITDENGTTIQMWDLGGCGNISPLLRHYMHKDIGMLYLHRLADDRIEESVKELGFQTSSLIAAGGAYVCVILTRQDLIPPEERKGRVYEAKTAIEREMSQFTASIPWDLLDCDEYNVLCKAHAWRTFAILAEGLRKGIHQNSMRAKASNSDSAKKDLSVGKVSSEISPPSESELVSQIRRESLESSLSSEDFMAAFSAGTLEPWNHWNHLRAGYLILLEAISSAGGIWTAVQIFLSRLEHLLRTQPGRFRNTVHQTMTHLLAAPNTYCNPEVAAR